jgi:hypothetical protein
MEVIQKLKPKAASLGFNDKELEAVANQIKVTLPENATDEQIDAAIDAALPILKVTQTAVNRIVNANKKKEGHPDVPDGSGEPKRKGGEDQNSDEDEEPAWFKKFRTEQEERLNKIEQENVTKSRRTVIEEMIKDLPEKTRASKVKDFDRMVFKDDTDFEAYKTELTADVTAIKQELADAGLSKFKIPGGGDPAKTAEEDFVKTMAEINKHEEKKD